MTTDTIERIYDRIRDEPVDFDARLVLADALEESGVPELAAMADGYRAMARWRRRPFLGDRDCWWWRLSGTWGRNVIRNALPYDWFALLDGRAERDNFFPPSGFGRLYTVRDLEDAAALAFSKLPAQRRAELLAGEAVLEAA